MILNLNMKKAIGTKKKMIRKIRKRIRIIKVIGKNLVGNLRKTIMNGNRYYYHKEIDKIWIKLKKILLLYSQVNLNYYHQICNKVLIAT
jgi:hypothetical protein